MPISSLPSPYGIGSFSKEAYAFVDFLEQAGQKLWQILPLGPTGYGDSPYQSFSTFAGNPYYIDLENLIRRGYLTRQECEEADLGDKDSCVDYEKQYYNRFPLLEKAYLTAMEAGAEQIPEYQAFKQKNAFWLEDYALYMAIKEAFNGICWIEWEEKIRRRDPKSMKQWSEKQQQRIQMYQFIQYLFYQQWSELKSYANQKGIEIVGDIPIYVAFDSADTWSHPELFALDEEGIPTGVAGCPPDAFSATGQLWGNPLYKWDYHYSTGYEWWIQRIQYCYQLYDILRIDHFRGFDEYWWVPYGDSTAERGHWEKGPGYVLFQAIQEALGETPVIAEDLGFLTESVLELVKKTGYPGMKVLQFAFDSREESDYLPHNYPRNCVVYTGTHDNDTTLSWYQRIPEPDREYAKQYLNLRGGKKVHWDFIRAALSSVADTAVIPLSDYLGLGSEARINTPSTLGENWKWRMHSSMLTKKLASKIRQMTKMYGRL